MQNAIEMIIQRHGYVHIVDVNGNDIKYYESKHSLIEYNENIIPLSQTIDGTTEYINVNNILKFY